MSHGIPALYLAGVMAWKDKISVNLKFCNNLIQLGVHGIDLLTQIHDRYTHLEIRPVHRRDRTASNCSFDVIQQPEAMKDNHGFLYQNGAKNKCLKNKYPKTSKDIITYMNQNMHKHIYTHILINTKIHF